MDKKGIEIDALIILILVFLVILIAFFVFQKIDSIKELILNFLDKFK